MITETARQRAVEYLVDVPALTIKNPWPVAIAWPDLSVAKLVENRIWQPSARVDRFMVHAGKGWDKGWGDLFRQAGIEWGDPASSAITAVVDIAHVCDSTVNRGPVPALCGCGPWAVPGRYHWRLCNVIPLPEPVKCNGRQKFWRPDTRVVAAVTEQLAAIRFIPEEAGRG